MILLHGTTQMRAVLIQQHGPNPCYLEPGGQALDCGFSMNLEVGPFHFGHPADYARSKALKFPAEGGAALLVVDMPDRIVQLAVSEWFPLSEGLVQFDTGVSLDALLAVWSTLKIEIRSVI